MSAARPVQAATDLGTLRREAEHLARERNERATTLHVLVALSSREGLPCDLLSERGATPDKLKKALRISHDDEGSGLDKLFEQAREIAGRTRRMTATGADVEGGHVLLVMCNDRTMAAHRALTQLGTDVGRLRGALIQHLTGAIEPRRKPAMEREEARPSGTMPVARPIALRPLPLRPLPSRTPTVPPPAPEAEKAPPSTPEEPPVALAPAEEPREHAPLVDVRPRPPKNTKRHKPLAKVPSEPTRFDLDPRLAPALATIGVNLTALASRGELDPIVGRDAEIERTLDVLAKRTANNPCLVGAPGVGKTAIASGVAQRIAAGLGVAGFEDRILVEVPIGELLAGTGVRGALAERLGTLRREVLAMQGRVVLFLDEIHALLGGDAGEEAANELKTALARGELPCIGATTPSELKRSIERDPALARRFSIVEVPELDPEAARTVVETASNVLARHHGVTFEADAKDDAVAWTVRYVPSRALPDKAIAALDLAGARAKRTGRTRVDREALAEVVAEMADVPIERLLARDADRFLELEKHLAARVVGHKEPIARIARALRRGAAGLRGQRPLLSALLLGPTGVGKTETAKAIAEVLFHDATALTRIDLSEYSEPHTVARLLGAPPGYVGHEDGGQLTESVRRRPYQVVLFDEMEKAHRDVLEALLQLLDEGRLTDGRGRTVDFTNTVVVLTSNLGSEVAAEKPRRMGFGVVGPDPEAQQKETDARVLGAARGALPPELYNRFDEVIVYHPLDRGDALAIAEIALRRLEADLHKSRGLRLQVDREALELLLDEGGFDPSLGGRPIRREISRRIEAPLAELLLRGTSTRGDVVWIAVDDGQIVIDLVTPPS